MSNVPDLKRLRELMTTPKRSLISRGNKVPDAEQQIVEFFAGMPESTRREIAPEIMRWRKEAGFEDGGLLTGLVWLGIYATATLAEMKRYSWWNVGRHACRIVADRDVPWLQDWAEQALEEVTSSYGIGEIAVVLVDLVDQGRIRPPQHDSYAIGVAHLTLEAWMSGDQTTPADQVRPFVGKIEHAIWRQFEVEGGGEISLANFDKYISGKIDGSWANTLLTFSREGLLDRKRLLSASLEALNRGFKQYRAGWFSRFHELLEPELEERAKLTDKYLDLLASPIGPTVSMAMDALQKLQKAGKLDNAAFLERAEPVVFAPAAKTVKTALRLIHAAATGSENRSRAAGLAACCLEHPKMDVQEAGLAVLEALADDIDDAGRTAITDRLELVSPTLRPRAAELIGGQDVSPSEERIDSRELLAIARRLPAELSRLAGIDAAVDALVAGHDDIGAAPFNGMDIPRLDDATRLEPISTYEELLEQALVAAEHPGDLDRVERVLCAAARLADMQPDDANELTKPLRPPIMRFAGRRRWIAEYLTPRFDLQDIMLALCGERPEVRKADTDEPAAVIVPRTLAIVDAVLAKQPRVVLSEPTHAGCWIDPQIVVERTRHASNAVGESGLGLADQCLALLRLAPDNRQTALENAQGLDGEWASALRYALGSSDEQVGKSALWIAASRSRAPFADDPALEALIGLLRGASRPPGFKSRVIWEPARRSDGSYAHVYIAMADEDATFVDFGAEMIALTPTRNEPSKTPDAKDCLTTVALSDPETLRLLDTTGIDGLQVHGTWQAGLWPQNAEPLFALNAKDESLLDGVVGWKPATVTPAVAITLLHDPDVPVSNMGAFMLARGLNALDKATAQATVDTLIAVFEDGRIAPRDFGAAMHLLLMGGIVVAKRWQDRLTDVAGASAQAATSVRRAIEHALYPGTPQRPMRNMHAWLEVLLDLCISAGMSVDDPQTREGLGTHFTSGKAKTLAKKLLALEPDATNSHAAAAAAQALEHRIARVERWQSRLK